MSWRWMRVLQLGAAAGGAWLAVRRPSAGAALALLIPLGLTAWRLRPGAEGRRLTGLLLIWAASVACLGALMAGAISGASEDIPTWVGALPLPLLLAGAAAIGCRRSAHWAACIALAASPLLGLASAHGWVALQTRLHSVAWDQVSRARWNAQAHEGNWVPELSAEAICVYHWTPSCRRIGLLRAEDGEPYLVVDIERSDGRLEVTGAWTVWWMSSGTGGVWPNR